MNTETTRAAENKEETKQKRNMREKESGTVYGLGERMKWGGK
jgi:hypothetical protein